MTAERFWEQVNKHGPVHPVLKTRCWLWTGGQTNDPHVQYGRLRHGTKSNVLAHRMAFFLAYGRWPTPCGLHKCDVSLCCRPEHLFEGTMQTNVKDRDNKGRGVHGTRHHCAKLTPAKVRAMRNLYAIGVTTTALGRKFGICRMSARAIVRRENWKEVH